MKKALFILVILSAAWACASQRNYSDGTDGRYGTFTLTVTDQNGRVVRNPNIAVTLSSDALYQPVRFYRGMAVIQKQSPTDTLFILSGQHVAALPISDLEWATIRIDGNNIAGADPNSAAMLNTGYGFVYRDDYIRPASHLDLTKEQSLTSYTDLASYLEGRVAGLRVIRGRSGEREIQIRGQKSLLMSNAALIVVDGVAYESFEMANNSVHINDIQSIDVLKDGSMYGLRGANGVVVITTKTGKPHRR